MARNRTPVTKLIPAHTARTQFGQILERVKARQARFVVSKNGEPAAVILGIEDYLENLAGEIPEELAALQELSRKRGLDLLTMEEIDTEIAEARAGRRKKRA